jgi:hypothetical protein
MRLMTRADGSYTATATQTCSLEEKQRVASVREDGLFHVREKGRLANLCHIWTCKILQIV